MKRCCYILLFCSLFPMSVIAQKHWMKGVVFGTFITSNPDITGYNVKKNYVDWGGGFVLNYRKDFNESATFEWLFSPLISSCKTSVKEDGETKLKFTFPIEHRFYLGNRDFKAFLGFGLQYNFIYSIKSKEKHNTYSYGYYDWFGNYYGYEYDLGSTKEFEEKTMAHQLSGNGSVGVSFLGPKYPIHFILGAKFHFPIINNAEGVGYSEGSRFDLSKDKTSIAATVGVTVNLGGQDSRTGYYRPPVLMLNYDYPLGSTKETAVTGKDTRSFFESHSQSITMSLLF